MRRRLTGLVTVLAAVFLVVSAMPVAAASTNVALGGQHTTASDLNNGTLTNMSVVDSGSSAYIKLHGASYVDSFDSEAADAGAPNGWTTVTAPPSQNVTTTYAYDGSQSYHADGSGGLWSIRPSYQPISTTTDNISLAMRGNGAQLRLYENGTNIGIIDIGSGQFQYYDGSWHALNTSIGYKEWVHFTVYNINPATNTYSIKWTSSAGHNGSQTGLSFNGNVNGWTSARLQGNGGQEYFDAYKIGGDPPSATYISAPYSVGNATTGYTNLDLVSESAAVTWQQKSGGTWSTINSGIFSTTGNHSVDISSATSSTLRVKVVFTKTGANPTANLYDDDVMFTNGWPRVSNPSPTGTVHNSTPTLSVDESDPTFPMPQGDSATVHWYVDGSSVGTSSPITANGTATYTTSALSDGSHTWHAVVDDSYGGSTALATQSFTVQHYAPTVDNASATPQGGVKLTSKSSAFSIGVNDTDFGIEGDTVTVNFYIDGSLVDTQTATSNGTVTTIQTVSTGGAHTWHASVHDSYNPSTAVNSSTFSFSLPGSLKVYNESAPTTPITNATIELEYYYQDPVKIVNRSTTNGTINMTGLPANRPFVVVASAKGYVSRRIYVTSLYSQQKIYLLPDTASYVEPTFVLKDYSGEFPSSDTVLQVQRAINGSWQTVDGDYFGASGSFPAQLAYNVRHRLVVTNTKTGRTKVLGPYTPTTSTDVAVTIQQDGTVNIHLPNPVIGFSPSTHRLPRANGTDLTATVDNQSTDLSTWSVTIYYVNATVNQTLATVSRTGPGGGSVTRSLDLAGRNDGYVFAHVEYQTAAGETGVRNQEFKLRKVYQNQYSLLAVAHRVTGRIPAANVGEFTTMASVVLTLFGTVTLASQLRLSTEGLGLVALLFLGLFSIAGWLAYSVVFISGVAFVALAGLRRGL